MSLAFDPSSVFSQAIEDHLAVIDSLRDQQSLLQRYSRGNDPRYSRR